MKSLLLLCAFALLLVGTSCIVTGRPCCRKPGQSCGVPPKAVIPGKYVIRKIAKEAAPAVTDDWEAPAWEAADIAFLSNYRPESKYYGARIYLKMLHDGEKIYVIFHGLDRFTLAGAIHPKNSFICFDTCGELFLAPGAPGKGYFNIEASLSGTYLAEYHPSQRGTDGDAWGYPSDEDYNSIQCFSSQYRTFAEIPEENEWWLSFQFGAAMMTKYLGVTLPESGLSGLTWGANFYHCADQSSHPRWLAWMPVSELNFHNPNEFGTVYFE